MGKLALRVPGRNRQERSLPDVVRAEEKKAPQKRSQKRKKPDK
ncbi:hypothetical protein [Floridanema flaviceps]